MILYGPPSHYSYACMSWRFRPALLSIWGFWWILNVMVFCATILLVNLYILLLQFVDQLACSLQ